MRQNRKIVFLEMFLLLVQVYVPYSYGYSHETIKDNQVSYAKLCCCENTVMRCRECYCSVRTNSYTLGADGSQRSDKSEKQYFTISYCGSDSYDISVAPEHNGFFSLSSYDIFLPRLFWNVTISPSLRKPCIEVPYKPPKPSLLTSFTHI